MNRPLPRLRYITTPEGGDPTPGAPVPAPKAPKPAPHTPPADDQPTEDEPLGEGGKKALAAERAARKAAEDELAAIRKAAEDSKKSAEQKAADDLTAAQRESAENAAKALRYEVAAAKGLDLALASRLNGSTKEELEADADVLKALIPTTTPPADPKDPPVPTVGTTPNRPGNVPIADQIAAAEKAGEKNLVAALKAVQLGQAKAPNA